MMKHALLSLLFLTFVSMLLPAIEPQVPDDEEDPYFLLSGQADEAIREEKYDEAAARLIEAMSIRPESPENVLLLSNLGMVYSYMGRDSLALATLNDALRRAPSMRTVLRNRGRILLKLGRDREAYDDFSIVLKTDSVNLESLFYRGTIALYSGDKEQAEKDFGVLQRHYPDDTCTAQALSSLYFLTNRNKEAIPYFKRIIEVYPEPEYYAPLAGCYLALGNLTEASATLAEAMAKFPNDPELYYYRAMLNRDRYRPDEAHADAKRAVKLGLRPEKARSLFEEKR